MSVLAFTMSSSWQHEPKVTCQKGPGIKDSHPRGGRTRLVPWTKEARGQSQEVTSQRLGHQRCFSNDQSSEALDVSWVSDNFIQF